MTTRQGGTGSATSDGSQPSTTPNQQGNEQPQAVAKKKQVKAQNAAPQETRKQKKAREAQQAQQAQKQQVKTQQKQDLTPEAIAHMKAIQQVKAASKPKNAAPQETKKQKKAREAQQAQQAQQQQVKTQQKQDPTSNMQANQQAQADSKAKAKVQSQGKVLSKEERREAQRQFELQQQAAKQARREANALTQEKSVARKTPLSKESVNDLLNMVREFISSKSPSLHLHDLSPADRAKVHTFCHVRGILSKSEGSKANRVLILSKPPNWSSDKPRQTQTTAVQTIPLLVSNDGVSALDTLMSNHINILRPLASSAFGSLIATSVSAEGEAVAAEFEAMEDADAADAVNHMNETLHRFTDPNTFAWNPPASEVPNYKKPTPHPNRPTDLPAFRVRDLFLHCVENNQIVIVAGATGCGKSTQFPQFLFDHMKTQKRKCKIIVTQPRRLAAITLAERVADERGQVLTRASREVQSSASLADKVAKIDVADWEEGAEDINELNAGDEDNIEIQDDNAQGDSWAAVRTPDVKQTSRPNRAKEGRAAFRECSGVDVGYNVRHDKVNVDAPLLFCTVGVLLRQLTDQRKPLPPPKTSEEADARLLRPSEVAYYTNPHSPLLLRVAHALRHVTHVIIDEVHERGKLTDFVLTILRDVCLARKDLRIIIMSATLDGALLSSYFGGAPVVEAEGRTFPVTTFNINDVFAVTNYNPMRPNTWGTNSVKNTRTTLDKIQTLIGQSATEGSASKGMLDAELLTCVHDHSPHDFMEFYDNPMLREVDISCQPSTACGCFCPCHVRRYSLAVCAASFTAQLRSESVLLETQGLLESLLLYITDCESPKEVEKPTFDLGVGGFRNLGLGALMDDENAGDERYEDLDMDDLANEMDNMDISEDNDSNFQLFGAPPPASASASGERAPLSDYNELSKSGFYGCPETVPTVHMPPINDLPAGSILIFVPGWAEISNLTELLTNHPVFGDLNRFLIVPLHSSVPMDIQQSAFVTPPEGVWKIVISTNIAETSVTIPDAVYVIDLGTMKVKGYNPEQDMSTFKAEWCAKTNAIQRAGRAGRVQAGYCFRLYSSHRQRQFDDFEIPELLRTSLEDVVLLVKMLLHAPTKGVAHDDEDSQSGETMTFLSRAIQPPQPRHVLRAIETLQRLNGIDEQERVTPIGLFYNLLPIEPRHTRLLIIALIAGCLDHALTCVASFSSAPVFSIPRPSDVTTSNLLKTVLSRDTYCDHMASINGYYAWVVSGAAFKHRRMFAQAAHMSHSACNTISRVRTQLFRLLKSVPHLADMVSDVSISWTGEMVARGKHENRRFGYVSDAHELVSNIVQCSPSTSMAVIPRDAAVPLCNRYAHDTNHVAVILAAGMYPKFGVQSGNNKYDTATNRGTGLFFKSLTKMMPKILQAQRPVVSFSECIMSQSNSMTLRDTSLLPPLALLLLSPPNSTGITLTNATPSVAMLKCVSEACDVYIDHRSKIEKEFNDIMAVLSLGASQVEVNKQVNKRRAEISALNRRFSLVDNENMNRFVEIGAHYTQGQSQLIVALLNAPMSCHHSQFGVYATQAMSISCEINEKTPHFVLQYSIGNNASVCETRVPMTNEQARQSSPTPTRDQLGVLLREFVKLITTPEEMPIFVDDRLAVGCHPSLFHYITTLKTAIAQLVQSAITLGLATDIQAVAGQLLKGVTDSCVAADSLDDLYLKLKNNQSDGGQGGQSNSRGKGGEKKKNRR